MKKLLLPLLLFVIFIGNGQTPPPKAGDPQKIEAMKVGFITNKLQLTPEEAKVFWPIYNQYEAEKKAARKSTLGEKEDFKPLDQLTDAEAQKLIENQIAWRSKELDLLKKYVGEFKKVLPVKKVAKLLMVEEQFKKMLIEKAKENPQNQPKPKP